MINLRIFDDNNGKRWSRSVADQNLEILCVSQVKAVFRYPEAGLIWLLIFSLNIFQFTLYAVMKGNKPDYHQAMAADNSQAFYDNFLTELRKKYKPELVKGIMIQ